MKILTIRKLWHNRILCDVLVYYTHDILHVLNSQNIPYYREFFHHNSNNLFNQEIYV